MTYGFKCAGLLALESGEKKRKEKMKTLFRVIGMKRGTCDVRPY